MSEPRGYEIGGDPTALYPLRTVPIVDLTTTIAGSMCAKVLADGGATVTRIESAEARAAADLMSADWRGFLNRGKEKVRLEFERGSGRDEFENLLQSADVVISSYRHEDAETLALDCAAVLKRHPHLTMVCITPFGQDGPYSAYHGRETAVAALAGLSDATPGFPDKRQRDSDPPLQSLAPLTEMAGGLTAACVITSAIVARAQGRPVSRHIEVPVLEAAVSMMTFEWGLATYGGRVRGRRPGDAGVEPNYYARCKDGNVIIAAFTESHWKSFVELMGNPGWALQGPLSETESRTQRWREVHGRIDEWAGNHTGIEILEAAQARALPFCPALELMETIRSEHVLALEGIEFEDDVPYPSDPILVNGIRRLMRRRGEMLPSRLSRERHDAGARDERGSEEANAFDRSHPLSGVRVVDLTQYVAGPFAGQHLASLGADVILVESRTHLVTRLIPPFAGDPTHDASMNFNYVNRGKRSILLNLRTSQGRAILDDLIASADIVLENFSRRAAKRLGLTMEHLAEKHPRIILGSISGFGRSGPWGGYVALHSGVILLSGLASVTRDETGRPRLVGSIYPDLLTGAYLAIAVQQALAAREQSGVGSHVEISMLDVLLSSMGGLIPQAAQGYRFEHDIASVFLRTKEPDRFLAVAADDYDRAGGESLAEETQKLTQREAMVIFQGRGLEAAAVLDIRQVMQDSHLTSRAFVHLDDHPVVGAKRVPGLPWKIDGERPQLRHAPCLGADTNQVLLELGKYTSQQIKDLTEQGVLL